MGRNFREIVYFREWDFLITTKSIPIHDYEASMYP